MKWIGHKTSCHQTSPKAIYLLNLWKKIYFEQHTQSVHGGAQNIKIKPQKFKCFQCDKGFISAIFLSRHMQYCHTNKEKTKKVETFICPIWGKSFEQKHHLKIQADNIHDKKCITVLFVTSLLHWVIWNYTQKLFMKRI